MTPYMIHKVQPDAIWAAAADQAGRDHIDCLESHSREELYAFIKRGQFCQGNFRASLPIFSFPNLLLWEIGS